MTRTCIIGGGPTGSREHIFPAALGGRRTNKGIYCGKHNNDYSGLANIVAEQLAIFNAQLGVVGDHADEPTPVTMTDMASGREIELTNTSVQFKSLGSIPATIADGETIQQAAFRSQKEADEWIREQRAKGIEVKIIGQAQKVTYHCGAAHRGITLGGTDGGLRAIGYIAQTFLAHHFPEVARLPEMRDIKEYTLKNVGSGFVWWDFEPPDLPPNKFAFGHRIIVGLNKDEGSVYARLSFFSTLNFAAILGKVAVKQSQSIITDIDPLAQSAPNDIFSWTEEEAKAPVSRPGDETASLARAIGSGQAQARINELAARISDFNRQNAARQILAKIAAATALTQPDLEKLFAEIAASESQRVFQLVGAAAQDCKRRASTPAELAIAGFLEKSAALDPNSANGLSEEATSSLAVACDALAKKMREDFEVGVLDQDRMEMLIGGGIGSYTVAMALLAQRG
jgi:hypothetical protein